MLLLAALLPLALAGFGSWIVFGKLIEAKSLEQMRTVVQSHGFTIESRLRENRRLLQLAAEMNSLQDMKHPDRLRSVFDKLNHSSDNGFIDLGIIDDSGSHLAYIGPYELQNRNYRDAEWFREALTTGQYISDVFMGFRNVPHCVIAIRMVEDGRPWILRATINSEQFDRLVAAVPLAEGSAAYILNRGGLYQTAPVSGAVLDRGPIENISYHSGVSEQRVRVHDADFIRVTTWINDGRWMLVVEQDVAAVQAPVNQAIADGALVVAFAILLLIGTAFIATWHLTNLIEKTGAERDELSQAFIRSAKLASIGELATGLAHEINNPLAIISAEQTNISDLLGDFQGREESRKEITESIERCKSQVQRCAGITRKMLQFGRRKEPKLEATNVGSRLLEIVGLLQRRAGVYNIEIIPHIEDNLPPAFVDPIELEQVLVNLINNAFDALPGGGKIKIHAYKKDNRVQLDVADNGTGIAPENLNHIFEPFFTTKEVGKGTGLGLSVCYGIVTSWGGRIGAESEPGKGTTISIILPVRTQDAASGDRK